MPVSKILIDGVGIDLTTDTVSSSDDIAQGKIGHLNDGTVVTGTHSGGGGYVSPYFAEYDFENSLNDLAREGIIATPYGNPGTPYPYEITQDGIAIKTAGTVVDLHIPISIGLVVEVDIASETRATGSAHARLLCWAADGIPNPDSGIIRRSNNYWAIYTSAGSWTYTSDSNKQGLAGTTVKAVFRPSAVGSGYIACDAYIDGTLIATNEKLNLAHTNLYLCSSQYGTMVTVSKIRAYYDDQARIAPASFMTLYQETETTDDIDGGVEQ